MVSTILTVLGGLFALAFFATVLIVVIIVAVRSARKRKPVGDVVSDLVSPDQPQEQLVPERTIEQVRGLLEKQAKAKQEAETIAMLREAVDAVDGDGK